MARDLLELNFGLDVFVLYEPCNIKNIYILKILKKKLELYSYCLWEVVRNRIQPQPFKWFGITHANGWSYLIASQEWKIYSFYHPSKLRVLHWVATYLIWNIRKPKELKSSSLLMNWNCTYLCSNWILLGFGPKYNIIQKYMVLNPS